jgi:hypothetical protein
MRKLLTAFLFLFLIRTAYSQSIPIDSGVYLLHKWEKPIGQATAAITHPSDSYSVRAAPISYQIVFPLKSNQMIRFFYRFQIFGKQNVGN